jgi:hypothetical protein
MAKNIQSVGKVPYDTPSKLAFTLFSEISVRYRHSEMLEITCIDISKVEVVFLKF